jgi:hypothetical protein
MRKLNDIKLTDAGSELKFDYSSDLKVLGDILLNLSSAQVHAQAGENEV